MAHRSILNQEVAHEKIENSPSQRTRKFTPIDMRAKQEAEQHAQHTAFTEFSKQQAAQQAMFDIPETRVYGNSGERYLRDPPNMVNYDYVDRRHWHDSKKKYTDGRRKNRKFDYLSGTFTPE